MKTILTILALALVTGLLVVFTFPRDAGSDVKPPAIITYQVVDLEDHIDTLILADKIAWCESNNIPEAENPASTASGRFQFLDGTWKYYGEKLWKDDWVNKSKTSWEDSTELALFVLLNFGSTDWDASKHCWA